MTQHTKGPWHWVNSHTDQLFDFNKPWDGGGYPSLRTVKEESTPHSLGPVPKWILDAEPDHLIGSEANARLIAAAPDLLDALLGIKHVAEDFISDWAADAQEGGEGDPFEVAHWHKVLSAIAKATGEA
jgi:hypothetical protein